MNKEEFSKIEKRLIKVSSIETARNIVNSSDKTMLILMGDDNKYWIGRPIDTEKLNQKGYEYIK